jgi:hypothetical protein
MEKDAELYGIVVWDDGMHTLCKQNTAEYIRQYGLAIQGRILVDGLSRKEAEVLMKLLPRGSTMDNLTYDK